MYKVFIKSLDSIQKQVVFIVLEIDNQTYIHHYLVNSDNEIENILREYRYDKLKFINDCKYQDIDYPVVLTKLSFDCEYVEYTNYFFGNYQ